MYCIRRLFNPEIFQGKYKSKNYFEGWYYKLVTKDEKTSLAFIPGIAYDKKGNVHSFIQIIDSLNYTTKYIRYTYSDFNFSEKILDISIGKSSFSQSSLSIDIDDEDYTAKGELKFYNIEAFPKKITRPGIMGPFSFVPFMECYHGVVNIHHNIKGILNINGREIDFTGGYGYIEKDWGRSFPKWWVWLQSNNFQTQKASLMFSVAKIPWLSRYFTGFLSFLKTDNEMYLFSTYTRSKIEILNYDSGKIEILIKDKKYDLHILGDYDQSGVLKAPKNGLMKRKISESISSIIKVRLTDKNGKIIFDDYGKRAGLEIVGKHLNES